MATQTTRSTNGTQSMNLPRPFPSFEHEMVLSILLTGTIFAKEGDRVLRPLGLTDSQYQILVLLRDQAENGTLNQTELGNILLVNRSNITGLVDRMEKAGWVKRNPDATDRRVKQVSLTRKGHAILSKAEKIYQQRMAELIGSLNKKELLTLSKTLQKMRESVHSQQ